MSNPVSILIVDDEAKNLIALESILESPDYELVKAQTKMDPRHYGIEPERASGSAGVLAFAAGSCHHAASLQGGAVKSDPGRSSR